LSEGLKKVISMNKLIVLLATGALLSIDPKPAAATDLFAWNNHAAPLPFRFGNEFDGHQLSRRTSDGNVAGFLYIHFTGRVTKDGYRVASHGDCGMVGCTVGWTFNGKPLNGTLLEHEMHDHPLFLVNRADVPQPGAFNHFHWLGAMPMEGESASGFLLQLFAVDRFCFIHHDASSAESTRTCRDNGGIRVDIGLDMASHLNIVPAPPTM